jgi:hypothetical protein
MAPPFEDEKPVYSCKTAISMPETVLHFVRSSDRYLSTSHPGPMAHIIDEPTEEELFPGDRLSYFDPTQPGELLDGRFKTIAKLDFGNGSTVWLAENLEL